MVREHLWAAGAHRIERSLRPVPGRPPYAFASAAASAGFFPSKRDAVEKLSVINAFAGRSFKVGNVYGISRITLSDFWAGATCPIQVEGREQGRGRQTRGRGAGV